MLASRLAQREILFFILLEAHSRQAPLKTQHSLLVLIFVLINAWDPRVDCKLINLYHHGLKIETQQFRQNKRKNFTEFILEIVIGINSIGKILIPPLPLINYP
jgi:hypothetical protein